MIKLTEFKNEHSIAAQNIFAAGVVQLRGQHVAIPQFNEVTNGEYIIVALEYDVVVGFISLWLEENFIHHLYVKKNLQNRGIGTLLLNAAIKKMNGVASLKCEADNEEAIRFYLRKGFLQKETGYFESRPYILFEYSLAG